MFAMVIGSIIGNARLLFKYALFGTFMLALTSFSVWFVSFSNSVYQIIVGAANAVASSSMPDFLGCAMDALGLDVFITSAFSIFFSAMVFWVTAVGYIMAYKLGMKAYDGYFKVLS